MSLCHCYCKYWSTILYRAVKDMLTRKMMLQITCKIDRNETHNIAQQKATPVIQSDSLRVIS